MLYSPLSATKLARPVITLADHGLDDLADRIREIYGAMESNALDRAREIGEVALKVRERVPSLKRWLIKHKIPVSTTFLYLQVELNWEKIEAARRENPKFRLRDVSRLLATRRVNRKTKKQAEAIVAAEKTQVAAEEAVDTTVNVSAAAESATEAAPAAAKVTAEVAARAAEVATILQAFDSSKEAVTAALEQKGLIWFLERMPATWVPGLKERLAGLPSVDYVLQPLASEKLQLGLRLLKEPARGTKQQSNSNKALDLLRTIADMTPGEDLDRIGYTVAKEPVRALRKAGRRAA